MLSHALLLALELVGAIEAGQTVGVLGEVGGDPVDDDADAGGMEGVHHALEVIRVAVAGGGGIIAGDLIAPGTVIGVLGHGHQLHMGVAHILAVGGQGVAHQPVLGLFIAHVLPGAQMHLVNAHGLAEMLALGPFFHIGLVRPLVMAAVPNDGGGLLPVLGKGSKGVRLQHLFAVLAGNAVFIKRVLMKAFHKADPGAALHQFHGGGLPVPAVKIAHQRNGLGVGRPDNETVGIQFRYVAAAIAEPGLLCLANVKKVYVPRGDKVQVFGIHAHISLVFMYFSAGQNSRCIYYTYFPCQFQEKSLRFVQNRHFAINAPHIPRKKFRPSVRFSAYYAFFLKLPRLNHTGRRARRPHRAPHTHRETKNSPALSSRGAGVELLSRCLFL